MCCSLTKLDASRVLQRVRILARYGFQYPGVVRNQVPILPKKTSTALLLVEGLSEFLQNGETYLLEDLLGTGGLARKV